MVGEDFAVRGTGAGKRGERLEAWVAVRGTGAGKREELRGGLVVWLGFSVH